MTAEIKVIHCEPRGDDVRKTLLDMLVMARRGELSSVAIAYVDREGCAGGAYSDAPSKATLIGSIEALKHMVIGRWLG